MVVSAKISQLSNVSSSELTDLFEISRYTGGIYPYESRSVGYHDLLHSIMGNTITVEPSGTGSDASTIGDAIVHATELSPSADNPVSILLLPGVYTEDALTVPNYVSIKSIGGQKTSIVKPSSNGITLFNVSNVNVTLEGFRIDGDGKTGIVAVKSTGMGHPSCLNVNIRNVSTGFWATGSTSAMTLASCSVIPFSGVTAYGIRVEDGANVSINDLIIRIAGTGAIDYGIYVDGEDTICNVSTYRIDNATDGLYVNNGALCNTDSGFFEDCTNSLRIGPDGSDSTILCFGSSIIGSATYDALVESITGNLNFTGRMDYRKRSIASGSTFDSIGIGTLRKIIQLTGKTFIENGLFVGTPGLYTLGNEVELELGEGGSYVLDQYGTEIVEYWKYDNSAASGTRFERYANNAGTQLTDENDAIVVGSKFPFSAVTIDVNTAANVGGNSIAVEHWNGASWTSDSVATYKKSDFTHRANNFFQNVETQYVETGTGINSTWSSDEDILDNIPSWDAGIDMYALRFRNNGGSLVTAMEFDNGKVRGDDFDITVSKKTVNFGGFRQIDYKIIPVTNFVSNAVNPPSSTTVSISANISNALQTTFTDGNVSAVTFQELIPIWADTSSGVILSVGFAPKDATAGTVEFKVRYVPITTATTILDGTNTEYVASLTASSPGVTNKTASTLYKFDISSFSPGDLFAVSIERDARVSNPVDTYAGDVYLFGVSLVWTRKIIG